MKRFIFAALALVLAIGLQSHSARAENSTSTNPFWTSIFGSPSPALATPGVGLGIAAGVTSYLMTEKHGGVRHVSYGTAYGVTTFGCMVLYPIIGTIWLNRPLTPREAYVGMANCAVPILGGWVVDRILPHDAWTDGTPPKPMRHHK
ncbi:MAG: hypothetical protein WA776_18065 [Xanthobacteraceae bacterium]